MREREGEEEEEARNWPDQISSAQTETESLSSPNELCMQETHNNDHLLLFLNIHCCTAAVVHVVHLLHRHGQPRRRDIGYVIPIFISRDYVVIAIDPIYWISINLTDVRRQRKNM